MKRRFTVLCAAASALAALLTAAPAASAKGSSDGPCTISKLVNASGGFADIPATSGRSSWCTLRVGARNDAVWILQYNIRTCYPDFGLSAPDGIYGPETEASVRQIQRMRGLTIDGVYGPNTRMNMQVFWQYTSTGTTNCLGIPDYV
ncbi:peptidoglycan-binding protein [Kitasatospora phosalacinea]|uniref:peptidoglycan-binding domain-containing protein n=1 Tax=Kitasatospora phosalacinea TaxID=2065 RepID=UPI00365B4317